MRTTIVVPEALNRSIERFLSQTNFSKKEFFLRAIKQFLRQRANTKTLEALNRVYAENQVFPEDDTYKLALQAMAKKGL